MWIHTLIKVYGIGPLTRLPSCSMLVSQFTTQRQSILPLRPERQTVLVLASLLQFCVLVSGSQSVPEIFSVKYPFRQSIVPLFIIIEQCD